MARSAVMSMMDIDDLLVLVMSIGSLAGANTLPYELTSTQKGTARHDFVVSEVRPGLPMTGLR